MSSSTPWHKPGQWLVNPAYWDPEVLAERAGMPTEVHVIDCTLTEGDDCVGHQLNWNTRLELMRRLDAVGVGEITLPSHTMKEDERDLARAYRRLGCKTPLAAKGPAVPVPLSGDWRGPLKQQIDLGAETVCPIYHWSYDDTITDFAGAVSKQMIVDAVSEATAYTKAQGVRVVPWIGDTMRTRVDTVVTFARAIAGAGADGVYLVDSRGNSNPLASRSVVRRVKAAIGTCDVYIQHHNDLGCATANSLAAVEGGANWIDATVIGIGDRGGTCALEEIAAVLEVYGVHTGIRLDALYDLANFAREAFGVTLAPWKPLVGENWNREEGLGHLSGATVSEASIGIAPEVLGRRFESGIGAKILFGRERSSATTSEPLFLKKLIAEWGLRVDEAGWQTILRRARAAVATSYTRHYLTIDEFRAICESVATA